MAHVAMISAYPPASAKAATHPAHALLHRSLSAGAAQDQLTHGENATVYRKAPRSLARSESRDEASENEQAPDDEREEQLGCIRVTRQHRQTMTRQIAAGWMTAAWIRAAWNQGRMESGPRGSTLCRSAQRELPHETRNGERAGGTSGSAVIRDFERSLRGPGTRESSCPEERTLAMRSHATRSSPLPASSFIVMNQSRAAESNTRSRYRDIESTSDEPRFVDIHETTRASLSTGGFLSDIVFALRPFLPIGG
jgi:hypothetical protein